MEVSALKHQPLALRGPAPLLRLASDEQLVALIRRGQHSAFEALVGRYQARLLAFCRHMLRSQEDGEDVLQEVFAASFNALLADERVINVRPWLYRIARNRCLNHMRRTAAIGVDSMDVMFSDQGQSTFDKVTRREDFRLLLGDIGHLPETQRTAIVLREMDALSYEQIAEAMETSVPGVKSLLVRARVSLAEAAEARKLTCDEVRLELAAIAEGLASMSAPFRRHIKQCERCGAFRKQLRANNRAMAIALPIGPLIVVKKLLLAKAGLSFGGSGASATSAGAGMAASAGAGSGAAGALTAGALGTKAVASLAAAALVTAGAVEVRHTSAHHGRVATAPVANLPVRPAAPAILSSEAQPPSVERARPERRRPALRPRTAATPHLAQLPPKPIAPPSNPPPPPAPPPPPTTQEVSATAVLPPQPPSAPPAVPTASPPPVNPVPAPTPPPPPTTTTPTAPAPPVGTIPSPAPPSTAPSGSTTRP